MIGRGYPARVVSISTECQIRESAIRCSPLRQPDPRRSLPQQRRSPASRPLEEHLANGSSRQKLHSRGATSALSMPTPSTRYRTAVWPCSTCAPCSTCTRIGRSAVSATPGRAGEGSAEFKPRGMTGTITMKTMSMTSKTSISGVTLISEERPSPLEVPVVEKGHRSRLPMQNWVCEHPSL